MTGAARPAGAPFTAHTFISLAWMEQGLCTQADPDEWYPSKGNTVRAAKRVCARCPVTAQCLEYALVTDQEHGIWGGLSVRARRKLARERDAA